MKQLALPCSVWSKNADVHIHGVVSLLDISELQLSLKIPGWILSCQAKADLFLHVSEPRGLLSSPSALNV